MWRKRVRLPVPFKMVSDTKHSYLLSRPTIKLLVSYRDTGSSPISSNGRCLPPHHGRSPSS